TDSLAYADVVLPACSHFEHADLFAAYGTHWLQRADRVIPPQGEALPNTEIFRRLAARFGFDDPAFRASDAELMNDALDGADPRMGGKRPSAIPLDRATPMTVDGGGEDAILFKNVLPKTKSGKVELARRHACARLERSRGGPAAAPGYRRDPARCRLHAQGRVDGDQRQRPDDLGAVSGRPRGHFRGRLLQRRARRGGRPLRTRP